jgi:PAS domain S-box-containing protein
VSDQDDIAQRKIAEEALRKSEARFRSLIENAPDGVCILRWPTIVFANPRAARLLGCRTPEEAVGRNILTMLKPSEAALANERGARIYAGAKQGAPTEYMSRDPDGNDLIVEVSAMPIDFEGEPAVLGFARDVTERTAMFQQLMEADKLAAVGTLAAGVAHEINNPLAYLLLNLEFLLREMPKLAHDPSRLDALQRRLEEAKQGAERVKTIVRDLQTFTRRDLGIRGPVDLEAVIETAVHMARHEIRHRATIAKDFVKIPPVYGNTTRLEQLFLNLLINAAHAVSELSPERNRIDISLRLGSEQTAVATVRDNGTGMAPEVLRQVFDPFFTTKPTGVGTGLGLSICQGIVRALGGEIQITSSPGAGTAAIVTLPLHGGEPSPRTPTPLPPRPPVRRGRVLVIDDERAVAQSLAIALRDEHDVITLGSAAEARARFEAGERFDVVLCDLVMPGETGMHLYQHVRQTQPDLARRFAFMTGGAFLPETERFLRQVENPRIEKPFDVAAIRRLVDRLLGDE